MVGWAEMDMWESVGQLVKPAVLPLYVGGTDTVRAVIAVGVGLWYLDGVLDEIAKSIESTAKAWLVDASTGNLIASSPTGLSVGNSPDLTQAARAGELGEAGGHVQAVSAELLRRMRGRGAPKDELGSWADFKSQHPSGYTFEYETGRGSPYLVQVASINDDRGLDWIVVLSVPRPVFYSAVDLAKTTTIIATIALTVVMGSILFVISWVVSSHIRKLGVKMAKVSQMQWTASSVEGSRCKEINSMQSSFNSMALKLKRFWEFEQDEAQRKEDAWRRLQATRIRAAITEKEGLRHPMVLIKASTFIELGQLMRYEDLRDAGKLHVLDTMEEAEDFGRHHFTVFFSHQWLDWGRPDPEHVHHRCMTNAIRQLQKIVKNPSGLKKPKGQTPECPLEDMYVWVDYSSISQKHRGMQILAISALPVYSSISDAFVVIAPPAEHAASCQLCDLQSYDTRGWCRVETLSKVCGSGLDKMFLMTGVDSALEQVTIQTFKENLSLRVFEGNFSCCALGHRGQPYCDKELLVESVLGLYHQVLTSEKRDLVILEHIEESKERFFPTRFRFFKGQATDDALDEFEDRELFGELVPLVEDIAAGYAVIHVDGQDADIEGVDMDGRPASKISHSIRNRGSMGGKEYDEVDTTRSVRIVSTREATSFVSRPSGGHRGSMGSTEYDEVDRAHPTRSVRIVSTSSTSFREYGLSESPPGSPLKGRSLPEHGSSHGSPPASPLRGRPTV
jgi:HAMP domain-containing protein